MVEEGVAPEVRDIIIFLPGYPELVRKTKIMTMYRLSCLCLDHGKLDLPEDNFGLIGWSCEGPDLLETIETVQSYLLSSNPDCNIFTNAFSISECMEMIGSFARTVVESGYNPWTYIDFFDGNGFLKELVKCYREIRINEVDGETLDVSALDALCNPSPLPAQPPKIDDRKVR